jgi:[ribosomal protein S5]-alanine N-acetyltransferase
MTSHEIAPVEVVPGIVLRPTTMTDAAALCDAHIRNRDHLRRWDPRRPEHFFTVDGQRDRLQGFLEARDGGRAMPWVLTDIADGGRIAGVVNVTSIVRGPFLSAALGYWVDVDQAGRGIASAAVEAVCQIADEVLGLHRLQADTLLDNDASQRVLAKCGFEQVGTAPDYLFIDGRWQDLKLFQRILNKRPAD